MLSHTDRAKREDSRSKNDGLISLMAEAWNQCKKIHG